MGGALCACRSYNAQWEATWGTAMRNPQDKYLQQWVRQCVAVFLQYAQSAQAPRVQSTVYNDCSTETVTWSEAPPVSQQVRLVSHGASASHVRSKNPTLLVVAWMQCTFSAMARMKGTHYTIHTVLTAHSHRNACVCHPAYSLLPTHHVTAPPSSLQLKFFICHHTNTSTSAAAWCYGTHAQPHAASSATAAAAAPPVPHWPEHPPPHGVPPGCD